MRWILLALAIALAVAGAVACQADLEGAPCPCVMPEFTCIEVEHVCRRVSDSGPGGEPDASGGSLPDGGRVPDAGFFPDATVGLPDAS